jgi:uncharacterized protein YjiS (DUF1127 family)
MTAQTSNLSRPLALGAPGATGGLHELAGRLRSQLTRATRWLDEERRYHRTLAELRRLSDRDLRDIAIRREDVRAIARQHVRGLHAEPATVGLL